MSVIKRIEKENGIIECVIDSTNILMSEYDKSNQTLKLTFKAGTQYLYKGIIDRDYVRFEVSESQGSVFNKTLRKYESEKLGTIDVTAIKELIKENKGI